MHTELSCGWVYSTALVLIAEYRVSFVRSLQSPLSYYTHIIIIIIWFKLRKKLFRPTKTSVWVKFIGNKPKLSPLRHISNWRHTNISCTLSRCFSYLAPQRLRWSRGSVLAFGTQVRRSRRIFQGEKILSTPPFGSKVKPFVPCRLFTACKWSLNVTWKSAISRTSSSSFHY